MINKCETHFNPLITELSDIDGETITLATSSDTNSLCFFNTAALTLTITSDRIVRRASMRW
jgi:hypothetical protein